MNSRPLCRYCGKPIRKRTRMVCFGATDSQVASSPSFVTFRAERPRSKEEAQSLFNQEIVSVRWLRGEDYGAKQAGFDYITQASTWDGETYDDPFFCNGDHAKKFAYAAARTGHAMPAYFDAKKRADSQK